MRLGKYLRSSLVIVLGLLFALQASTSAAQKVYTERELRALGIYFVQDPNAGTCSAGSAGSAPSSGVLSVGSKVFFIGDSLTDGMVKIGGLLDKTKANGFDVDTTPTLTNGSTPIGSYTISGAYGKSVDATSGITIGDTTRLAIDHNAADISATGAIVIALGTNAKAEARADIPADNNVSGSHISDADVATAQAAEIPLLIAKIRTLNPTAPIFWLNTYISNVGYGNYLTINKTIADNAPGKYTVIDIASAIDAGTAPKPDGGEKGGSVHYAPATYGVRAQWVADQLKTLAASGSTSPTSTTTTPSASGFDPTSLSFPLFPDESALAAKIQNYIQTTTPNSPWLTVPNVGAWIVSESKSRGLNPMIIMGLGKQENNYGTIGTNARDNNNYFGMKGGSGYIHFDSPMAGLTAMLDALKRNIVDKTNPSYKNVTSFYEYVSVHQTGQIHYPGDGMNTYDPQMNVYVSWDTQYNPRNYWQTVAGVVTAITGVTVSPEIPARGSAPVFNSACATTASSTGTATATPAKGNASTYITDCGSNEGDAAIACTAINQLTGVEYSMPNRAAPTDPAPKFLDCSALVAMAIYRTFGVNLGGICSAEFITDTVHFKQITDMKTLQPGDMVGHGTVCGTAGHVALVAAYNAKTDDLSVMEASAPGKPSGIRSGKLGSMNFTWATHYIGQKSLQPGAL